MLVTVKSTVQGTGRELSDDVSVMYSTRIGSTTWMLLKLTDPTSFQTVTLTV